MTNEQTKLLIMQILERFEEQIEKLDKQLPDDIEREIDYKYTGTAFVPPHLSSINIDKSNREDYVEYNGKAIIFQDIYDFINKLKKDIDILYEPILPR